MDTRALAGLGFAFGALQDGVAAPTPSWQDLAEVGSLARQYVERNVAEPGGRLVVSVVPPDSRLRLPACPKLNVEPVEGQRLWGWTQVRVRCPGEAGWSLNLRTRVQVFAPAVLTRRTVSPGRIIEADDVVTAEIDLTSNPRTPLRDTSQVVGRVARVGLGSGQAVIAEHLRSPVVVKRGAQVEVTATIGQVTVTASGTALEDGAVGDTIRVKGSGGRLLEGVVSGEGRVTVQSN